MAWENGQKAEVKKIFFLKKGFRYSVQLTSNKTPDQVLKPFPNGEGSFNHKPVYPMKLVFHGAVSSDTGAIADLLKDSPAKVKAINKMVKGEIYDLDASPNLYNSMLDFFKENKITTDDIFSVEMKGSDFDTYYELEKIKPSKK